MAWGDLQTNNSQLAIMHYDLGVLLTPATCARAAAAAAFTCGPFGPPAAGAAAQPPQRPDHRGAPPIRLVTTMARGAAPAGGLLGSVLALPVPYALPPRAYDRNGGDTPWDIGPRDPDHRRR